MIETVVIVGLGLLWALWLGGAALVWTVGFIRELVERAKEEPQ